MPQACRREGEAQENHREGKARREGKQKWYERTTEKGRCVGGGVSKNGMREPVGRGGARGAGAVSKNGTGEPGRGGVRGGRVRKFFGRSGAEGGFGEEY